MANLLTIARFPGVDQWNWLLDASGSVRVTSSDLPYSLCNNNRCGANGVAAIANMLAHGVSPDDITVDLRLNDSLCRGTLLHSAIVQKNEPMFNLLIDAGADAGSIVTAHPRYPANPDVGLSAIALAEQYWNDVIPILHAKKARDAVMRTVSEAVNARKAANSTETL